MIRNRLTYYILLLVLSLSGLGIYAQNTDKKAQAMQYVKAAEEQRQKQDDVEALRNYFYALKNLEWIGDSATISELYYQIGLIYYENDLNEKALEYLFKADNVLKDYKNDNLEVLVLKYTGLASYKLENYKRALVAFLEADSMNAISEQPELELENLFNIVECYNKLGMYALAIERYMQMLDMIRQEYGSDEEINALNNIAYLYRYLGDYTKAEEYFSRALKMRIAINDTSNLSLAYRNLGIIYQNTREFEKAIQYLQQALDISEMQHNDLQIAQLKNLISLVYLSQGDVYNAQIFNEEVLSKANDYPEQMQTAYLTASQISELLYDFEKALDAYKNYLDIRDSIEFEDFLKQQQLLQQQYNVERYERDIEMLIADEEIRNLEISRLKLDSANRQQELDLLRNENELQEQNLLNKELEKQQALQAKLLLEERLIIELQEKEVDSLKQLERIQALELETENYLRQQAEQELEVANQNQKIQELENSRLRTRNLFFVGIAFLALLLLFIVYRSLRYSRKTNRILKEQNEEIEAQKEEIQAQLDIIDEERQKSDKLLLNILPEETAWELKEKGSATPQFYDQVSVLFTDFVGFTKVAEKLSPQELVLELNECFLAFDRIIDEHNMEKIKTIGDAYMCAGGIPVANLTNHLDAVAAAMEISEYIEKIRKERAAKGEAYWELRIGIHTGNVVAGVVGKNKFAYDIWGDAVNTASRMESSGEKGKVNISGATYELIKDHYICEYRGKIKAKNKGEIDMYFVKEPKKSNI